MGWAVGTPLKMEDVFKKPSQIVQHKTGLKILIWGKEDTMKTGFALSSPPPVYIFDTEMGAPPLFQYFVGKDLNWCDAAKEQLISSVTDLPDPMVALQKLESTITLLKDVGLNRRPEDPVPGTIVIDSGTDIWDWIQAWLEGVGRHKEGTLLRFEWAKAKQKWRYILLRLFAKPMHFIMTAQPQEMYDSSGNATGMFKPRIQGASPHMFDIIIHAMKWETKDPKTMATTVLYKAEVTKCRFRKGWRPIFDEITFDKLAEKLETELKVKVW